MRALACRREPNSFLSRACHTCPMEARDLWDLPAVAWRRPIGDYPPGATGLTSPMEAATPPECRTKRGVPVGGIGTGSFMINLAGSFGPWEFSFGDNSPGEAESKGSAGSAREEDDENDDGATPGESTKATGIAQFLQARGKQGRGDGEAPGPRARWGSEDASGHEERFLASAAFHAFVEPGARGTAPAGGSGSSPGPDPGPVVKTLATEDVWSTWPRLARGTGTYHALFPVGWFTYDALPVPVAMRYFSPFIPRDYRASALPVALASFRVANPTAAPVTVALMFTFPNAPYRTGTAFQYTRKGLRAVPVKSDGIAGVRLQAEHPENVPATQRTEWVIAARTPADGTVSWAEWSPADHGTALMEAFSSAGALPDDVIQGRGEAGSKAGGEGGDEHDGTGGEAAAVAVRVTIPPGEQRDVHFALGWDFPVVQFKNPREGTCWRKRYKEWYPGDWRGWDLTREALADLEGLLARVEAWWRPIAEDPAYPAWLRQAALNELYYDLFGGVFWEAGCLSKPKRFGARPGQHLYFTLEANVYRDAETLDVRHYEARHLREMFPRIERDVLLAWADFIHDDPAGRVTHDAGSPVHDPYFQYGQYYSTGAGQAPPAIDWKDLPSMYVQQCHAYWQYTGDDAFVAEVYSAARKALAHVAALDADGDGIPENKGLDTTYDGIGLFGASTFVAGLLAGAYEAMAEFCTVLDKPAAERAEYLERARETRAAIEEHLWLPEGHYRVDTGGTYSRAVMTDALNGQRYAEVAGLPDVFPLAHRVRHFRKVLALNFRQRGEGTYGAINVVGEHGEEIFTHMAMGAWPGGTYYTAALMVRAGRLAGDDALVEGALAMAKSVADLTYRHEQAAFWFDTPALWYPEMPPEFRSQQNMRPRAIWELLLEIKDPFRPPRKTGGT